MTAKHIYCQLYGLDQPGRASRLTLLGLSIDDHSIAQQLQEQVIGPNIDTIIATFYDELVKYPQFMEILQRGQHSIDSLKQSQRNYLLSLGKDFESSEYCEDRLRVGMVHAKVGVPLGLYQSVYALLQRIIIGQIRASANTIEEQENLTDFLLKITNLDMTLAIETYHQKHVEGLENSVNRLRNEQVRLLEKAETDPLTHLANRGHIIKQLEVELREHQLEDKPLCVIMADLDHFKEVNDNYGHLSGDAVLRDVAARLNSAVRSFDLIGRYGGEEFIVVLKNTPIDVGQEVAERIRQRIASSPISVQGIAIPITISQGLVLAEPVEDHKVLLERADQALYAAKDAGRNCVIIGE